METQSLETQDFERRFSGVANIYGRQGLENFKLAHICVIGTGGVGSWVVEALARSAVGKLTLIDMDHSAESNINRQIQATTESLGQAKIVALKERIHSINPSCIVNLIDDFIEQDNLEQYLSKGFTWIIDCIDNYRTKASIIYYCRRNKIKLITVGGAGGMIDPSDIKIADLTKSSHDPLLAKTRKLLRQDYHFPTNPSRRFSVPCVYSEEQLKFPDGQGGISSQKNKAQSASGLNCSGGFGSAVVVTATMGFFATSHVLKKIAAMPSLD